MTPVDVALLVGAGLAAGFVAGLIGVGGGIIFAPVLFFFFRGHGVPPDVLAPLTIGSSLLGTLLAAASSAWFQFRRQAVDRRTALGVGLFSALAVFLLTRFVTTQPWYDGTTFQVVFSLTLLLVVSRMVFGRAPAKAAETSASETSGKEPSYRWPSLAGTGTAAGAIAAAAGVGGGVVLVPAYHQLLHLPMHRAVGTSSATIVLIALVGVAHYAVIGLGAPVPATAVGYVDLLPVALLALPAMLTARLGVWTAHRVPTRTLRLAFAGIAAFVAIRLLVDAFG